MECEVAPLLIHIKENQLILDLLELLKKYNYLDKIVLGVLDTSIIKTIKDFDKNVKILAFMPSPDHIEEFAKSGVDYIRLWEHWVNDQTVSKVKSFPVELWIMTNTVSNGINNVGETTPENLEKLLDIGVQGILINDIGILQEVLERR